MSSVSLSSSTSSNSTSSLYSDRTVISGLASGLDTESLIEEAVSGYQTKITELQAQVTKYEWKQEAYRDIITPMVSFNKTYLDSTSSTNLCSNSFFNNATKVTSNGTYADLITATGRTSSDVAITKVTSLAAAARYNGLGSALSGVDAGATVTGGEFDITKNIDTSNIAGTLSLTYGDNTISLSFGENEIYNTAQEMVDAINEKLADKTLSFDNGNTSKASEHIVASLGDDGKTINLTQVGTSNTFKIESASDNIKTALGLDLSGDDSVTSFTFDAAKVKSSDTTMVGYLSQKGFTITLDGTTKTIMGPTEEELKARATDGENWTTQDYIDLLSEKITKSFGKDKLTVTNGSSSDNMIALQFSVAGDSGSTFLVKSSAGEKVGISGSLSNYVDTSNTLRELLGDQLDQYLSEDADGNKAGTVTINGVDFKITEKTTMSSLLSAINSSDTANVSVSYSKTTKSFGFTASETGVTGQISMDNDLAKALFGETVSEAQVEKDYNDAIAALDKQAETDGWSDDKLDAAKAAVTKAAANVTAGKDAKFTAVINGQAVNMTRSSNTIELDGLTLNLKGTFDGSNAADATDTSNAVSFTVTADSDKIVDAIKSMITNYNAIASAVKSAYTTYPAQKSDGSSYEPLSDDDKADMSDSAIENYETKAKQGLLFMDSDLSSLYDALRNCWSSSSLKSIGITTSYSDGLTTVSLDENTLRQALEEDPDKVRDLFTSSTSTGGSYNGVAQKLSTVFNRYVKTYGATKGILIEKSGATEASASLTSNTWYNAISSLEEQIEKWQDKLSDKVDYYTTKFTNLETLISEMNSQSSMLSGLTSSY